MLLKKVQESHTQNTNNCFYYLITNLLYLNVFEMNFLILAKIHNRTQEVEQAFVALEWLKKIDEGLCGQLLMVFGCNLQQNIEFIIIPSQNTWEMVQNEMRIVFMGPCITRYRNLIYVQWDATFYVLFY
jgi:hypothetical protein